MKKLPPKSAPITERVNAAYERSEFRSKRALGLALGMSDGSLVGKWLSGEIEPSDLYAGQLEEKLKTPAGYFASQSRLDRLAEVERRLAAAEEKQRAHDRQIRALQESVGRAAVGPAAGVALLDLAQEQSHEQGHAPEQPHSKPQPQRKRTA